MRDRNVKKYSTVQSVQIKNKGNEIETTVQVYRLVRLFIIHSELLDFRASSIVRY
jgi:hypothetical protein